MDRIFVGTTPEVTGKPVTTRVESVKGFLAHLLYNLRPRPSSGRWRTSTIHIETPAFASLTESPGWRGDILAAERNVRIMTGNGRIRFWRDLPEFLDRRYVSDGEGQPFPWKTRLTDVDLSFDLPPERSSLSVLVERAANKHPVWLTANAGGDHYGRGDGGSYSLTAELIRSKLARLTTQTERYRRLGFRLQRALEDVVGSAVSGAGRSLAASAERLELRGAAEALLRLVDAGDALELAYARSRPTNHEQAIGCDVTMASRARADRVWQHVSRLFGYVTVTFYTRLEKTGDFEPSEGSYAFASRDALVHRAEAAGLDIEGRPLVWLHPWVTPDWLASKDLEGLRLHLQRRIPAMVGRYEGRIRRWEVTNEAHDWADVLHLSHEELLDVTRFACDLTRRSSPDVGLLINTTDPFGTYAAGGTRADGSHVDGKQWTPYTYLRDLLRGRVDFDLAGIQVYRPYRDLTDTVEMLERIEALGKPVFITEIGAPSQDDELGTLSTDEAGVVHRWDREQQADWAENMFTLLLSRPDVLGIAWYDLVDSSPFLPGGGLLDRAWRPKPVYRRIERILATAGRIPHPAETARP
jgi:GH35 family endo-1,4-beta-xylanase